MDAPQGLRRAEVVLAECWEETHDTRTFRFRAPASGLPPFRAGQFFALEVPNGAGWIRRSYSVASSPLERGHFDLTIKRVEGGAATTALFDAMAVGMTARATGPFGEFTLDESRGALFVAGGVGVTPIMSMLRTLDATASRLPATLLYSNRTRDDVIFERELRAIALRRPNVRLHFALTRAGRAGAFDGRIGRLDETAVRDLCAGAAGRTAYLCGPVPMMEEIGRTLLDLGFPPERIRTEAFVGVAPTFREASASGGA